MANAGDAVAVPRGTPHTYWNAGNCPARYLLVMGPQTSRLVDAIHKTSRREAQTMRDLFLAHGSELVG